MNTEPQLVFNRMQVVNEDVLSQLIRRADATSLPVADLVHEKTDFLECRKDTFAIGVSNRKIGELSLRSKPENKTSWISRIDIDYPSYMNTGIGSYAHLAAAAIAISNGDLLRNDPIGLSEDAMRVWQRFINTGVAEVVTDPWCKGGQYGWMGHFEIRAQ